MRKEYKNYRQLRSLEGLTSDEFVAKHLAEAEGIEWEGMSAAPPFSLMAASAIHHQYGLYHREFIYTIGSNK